VESYIKAAGMASTGGTVRASFQFRTHDEDGLLFFHQMTEGEVQVINTFVHELIECANNIDPELRSIKLRLIRIYVVCYSVKIFSATTE